MKSTLLLEIHECHYIQKRWSYLVEARFPGELLYCNDSSVMPVSIKCGLKTKLNLKNHPHAQTAMPVINQNLFTTVRSYSFLKKQK